MKPAFGKKASRTRAASTKGFGRKSGASKASEAPIVDDAPIIKAPSAPKDVKKNKPAQKDIPPVDGNAALDIDGAPLDPSEHLVSLVEPVLLQNLPPDLASGMSREDVLDDIVKTILEVVKSNDMEPNDHIVADIQTYLLHEHYAHIWEDDGSSSKERRADGRERERTNDVLSSKDRVQPLLLEHIDVTAASELPRSELADQVSDVVGELLVQEKINLNLREQRDLVTLLLNDMLGLGPLEPLLADDSITDIMVNGPEQVYVEQHGKLVLTDVKFRDNQHLVNIATRIVTAIGRRVDETSPICDARLADGSRVNVIIPPLAIDGASISIRKFAKQSITLDKMIQTKNISPNMGKVLKIAARCRLNILISGGTGSGKTTMLNALSRMIDTGERIVTIEDAAELQLQQPHVVRLETRPPNLEGTGEVTMRDLVKNSLRMRPDRVILGEIRGGEAVDMLQAMNTGHDGSLGTVHANRPREALTRMENMVNMAGMNLPPKAIRTQISDALDLIVQVSRMRDGVRRVQYVTEVIGMEGDVVITQDLFQYKFTGEDENGKLTGEFISSGVRPHFMDRAEYYGLGRALMSAMG